MMHDFVEYAFSEANHKTIILVPGYSGGLEVSTIQNLVEWLISYGSVNVFGIPMSYAEDTPDVFDGSQRRLLNCVDQIISKTPGTEIILIAKSLGGSLALSNYKSLPVSRMIILGCPVILGWPQRISLLKTTDPVIPDYKTEWKNTLTAIHIPTLILSGESDDLADNQFLTTATQLNPKIHLTVIENANHNLEDVATKEQKVMEHVSRIKEFSGI